jgi:ferredoxin
MLDLALEVFDTSRLSCQIEFDKSLDGLKVKIAQDALM